MAGEEASAASNQRPQGAEQTTGGDTDASAAWNDSLPCSSCLHLKVCVTHKINDSPVTPRAADMDDLWLRGTGMDDMWLRAADMDDMWLKSADTSLA